MDKIVDSVAAALEGVESGMTVLVGGFGGAGTPAALLDGLTARRLTDLTVVSNNAGGVAADGGLAALIASGAVRKLVASFPRAEPPGPFQHLYANGEIELELTPQGTLAERIRAGGSMLGGFYIRTAANTLLAEGREVRTIDGVDYLYERPIRGDFALIAAQRADPWGNLTYRGTTRNFGPIMAMAATTTVAQVRSAVQLGDLDPEVVVTPGVFVDRVVVIGS